MRDFTILFDQAEPATLEHPAYKRYGPLGFPALPARRPWIYSNFVQSLDGVASYKGVNATGAHISQSAEDRWLMDLLRAHADAVLLGINTLVEETASGRESGAGSARGPIYVVEDEQCRELRQTLGGRRELNIFVTGARPLNLADYAVFDGDRADAVIITTDDGARRLASSTSHPHVKVIIAGHGQMVELPQAMATLRRDLRVERLLCEGGPTLYGYMSRAGLIDEKFITISPVEIGLEIPREQQPSQAERAAPPRFRPSTFGAPGFIKQNAPWWRWMSCRRVGDHQFSRYRRV